MSGTNTEWGDQAQVTSVQLTATNPDGTPVVMMPALQGPSQQPVVVPGPALVEAAAALVPPGSVWHVVTTAPDASSGAVGDLAYLPATGDVYQKQSQTTGGATTAVWVVVGNIQGATGSNGSAVYSVVGTPSAGLGADGDQAIDPSNGNVWLKTSGTWSLEGSIKGPAGATPTFAQGITTTLPAGSPAQLLLDTTNPLSIVVNARLPQGAGGPPITQSPITLAGIWDASANNPPLASGVGTNGTLYLVRPAGNTTLDGQTGWLVGDWALFTGGVWNRITGAVISAVTSLVALQATIGGSTFFSNTFGRGFRIVGGEGDYLFHGFGMDSDGTVHFNGIKVVPNADGVGVAIYADNDTGALIASVDGSGNVTLGGVPTIPGVTFSLAQIPEGWGIGGAEGDYLPWLSLSGEPLFAASGSSTSTDFSEEFEEAFSSMVMATSEAYNRASASRTQPLMQNGVNCAANDGQSLAVGQEADPGLTTTALSAGVVMLGNDCKMTQGYTNAPPTSPYSPGNPPVALVPGGNNNLNPMKASATNVEPAIITGLYGLHMQDCIDRGVPFSDTAKTLTSNTVAVGGMTITLLSFNGPPNTPLGNQMNYWEGNRAWAYWVTTAARAQGKIPYLYKVRYQQGEADMGGGPSTFGGVIQTASGFAAALVAIEAAFWDDIVQTYFPEQYASGLRPLFCIAQTGGGFIRDNQQLGVPTGQIMAARQLANAILMEGGGNHQSRPDEGDHPTVNAQRMQGNKDAYCDWRWQHGLNSDFMCPHPELGHIVGRGSTVLIGYPPHTAPIKVATPYNGYARVAAGTALTTLGHSVFDDAGANTVISATVAGPAHVRLGLIRNLEAASGQFYTANTDQASWAGNTFIEDSYSGRPPAIGADKYTVVTGMEAGEQNDPTAGQYYPMNFQAKIFWLPGNLI